MQFTEALSRDEALALARFTPDFEPRYALEAGMSVVSLKRTLETAGFRPLELRDQALTAEAGMLGMLGKTRVTEIETVIRVPKLALAPPTHRFISYRGFNGSVCFTDRNPWANSQSWEVDVSNIEGARETPRNLQITAVLPPLPNEARQAVKDFPKSLVLWEADWQVRRAPLGDPAILVPLHGDLYAVAYTWDLTEIERKALEKAGA